MGLRTAVRAFYLSPTLDYRVDPPNVLHPDIKFAGEGLPISRILHRNPDVLQFAPQGTATYPPWSNPALFIAGLEAPFHLSDQIRTIEASLKLCVALLVLPIPLAWAAWLVLLFGSAPIPGRWRSILRVWPLFIVGTGGLSLYILIEFVPRLIAAFAALLWISLLCGIQFQRPKIRPRLTTLAIAVLILSLTATAIGTVTYHILRPPKPLQGPVSEAYSVASQLSNQGVRPGDVIAVIGDGEDSMTVARLARARIDVAISWKESNKFWQLSDPRARNDIYDAFRQGGAKLVLSAVPPPATGFEEWHRVADTGFYIHNLMPAAPR